MDFTIEKWIRFSTQRDIGPQVEGGIWTDIGEGINSPWRGEPGREGITKNPFLKIFHLQRRREAEGFNLN